MTNTVVFTQWEVTLKPSGEYARKYGGWKTVRIISLQANVTDNMVIMAAKKLAKVEFPRVVWVDSAEYSIWRRTATEVYEGGPVWKHYMTKLDEQMSKALD